MRIAICDDDIKQRDVLFQLVRAALSGESISYQVREYARAQDLLYDLQDGDHPDVVFVDTTMPLGWETVGAMQRLSYQGNVILMSDCGERAVEGYALGAHGYLMKPFDAPSVAALFKRLCAQMQKSCLTIGRHSQIIRVPYHEILYIESCNAKCVVHRADGQTYTIYTRLDELEQRLNDSRFLRCHQSYLVNMDHVASADRHFVMVNGDAVSIRQREIHRIREAYCAYIRSIEV